MGVGDDDESMAQHGAKDGPLHPSAATGVGAHRRPERLQPERLPWHRVPAVSETQVRVNYSETDQMGVVYHARYLVWLDVARTEHLRLMRMSYRELEAAGLRLAVSEVSVRYRQPARFDDPVRIRCWVRGAGQPAGRIRLRGRACRRWAPARHGLDHARGARRRHATRHLPERVRAVLRVVPDPVRL